MYYNISFPSLGIDINPSRIAFSIGSKPIYWYGIIIAVGFMLAVFYACKRADQFGLTEDNIINMLICAVPAAIVCARIYYCIFSWDLYKDNPISVLYIWQGGIAIYGGVIGAVLGLVIYTKCAKVKTSAMLDIGGLGLLIGQSIGRWGNFFNREAFGSQTESFLRMGLSDANGNIVYYHPTFLYESLWNALGLLILHFYSKRRKYDGQIFIMYLGWYGLGRMFIEGLRMDSLYIGGTNLRVSQLLAGICFLFAAIFLAYCAIFKEFDPDNLYVNQKKDVADAEENEDAAEADEASDYSDDAGSDSAAEEETDSAEETEDGETSQEDTSADEESETSDSDAE